MVAVGSCTSRDVSVAVKVFEFHVARCKNQLVAVFVLHLVNGVASRLLVGRAQRTFIYNVCADDVLAVGIVFKVVLLEEPVGYKAIDVAIAAACGVLVVNTSQFPRLLIVGALNNRRDGICKCEVGINAQSVGETVIEVYRNFPTFGLQMSEVSLWRRCSEGYGQVVAGYNHVFGVALKPIERYPNLIVEETQVYTKVKRFDALPGDVPVY